MQSLAVNGFVSASNLPLWAGRQNGFFREQGVELALTHPSGSIDQMRRLIEGRSNVLLTAFDNIIAYQRGQGAPAIGVVGDLVAIGGIDNGLLTLIATPQVLDVAGLKGRVLAVDALDTGFSFALKGILSHAGLDPAAMDYIAVGSTAGRWKALQDGRANGAVLTIPADVVAVEKGFRALTTVTDALGPYLGNVVAVRRDWADRNRPLIGRLLRAYRQSLSWTTDPANRQEAIAILRREMPELSPALADKVYERLVDPQGGLYRDMRLDPAGVRAVLDLRARYGPPWAGHEETGTYVDPSFLAGTVPLNSGK